MRRSENNVIWIVPLVLILGILIGSTVRFHAKDSVVMKRDMFISLKGDIQETMREQMQYRCCLVNPCTYCIEKTPGHGEGAECDCLEDIYNGEHPCGECIGEILEGHGNPLISEYFATAIADEIGEQHLDEIKQIIFEKYGMPIENQV